MRNLIFIFLLTFSNCLFSQTFESKIVCEKSNDKVIEDEFVILMNQHRKSKIKRFYGLDSISSDRTHYLLNLDTIWNHMNLQHSVYESNSTEIIFGIGRQNSDSISKQMFNLLLNSPKHKSILLDKKYKYFGLSISFMKYEITTPILFGSIAKFDYYKFICVVNFL